MKRFSITIREGLNVPEGGTDHGGKTYHNARLITDADFLGRFLPDGTYAVMIFDGKDTSLWPAETIFTANEVAYAREED